MKQLRRGLLLSITCTVLIFVCWKVYEAFSRDERALSLGTSGHGRIRGAVRVPCSGDNFTAFSWLACALGRNFAHPLVVRTVVDAYARLATDMPERTWQYGEIGWEDGGRFWPHKSHQNGVSVDFLMPVRSEAGKVALLPVSPFQQFGYGLEFDRRGRLGELKVDWRALAHHLLALEAAGLQHGVSLVRVIVATEYHAQLLGATQGRFRTILNRTQTWIRHDEHYHVEFGVPQEFRAPYSGR